MNNNKYEEFDDDTDIEHYPSILEHNELPFIDRIKIILTRHCWISFDSDHVCNSEQPCIMQYKTSEYGSGVVIENLKCNHKFEGIWYHVQNWLPLTEYSIYNVPLKFVDRLRTYLMKFCWVSMKDQSQAPIGRMVLIRAVSEEGDEYASFGQLASEYDGMKVTHWFEILHSVDAFNLENE